MIRFEDFAIDDLFEKIKTKTLNYKADDLKGKYNDEYNLPALTAGIENQGLAYYVPRKDATVLKKVISVSANGANTGIMFYQPHEFTVLQDSYAIKFKGYEPNNEQYLYLITALQKTIRGNYDWTNKAGWERIKTEKISLPVTQNGKIDFVYMEYYIRKIKSDYTSKLKGYLQVTGLDNYNLNSDEQAAVKKYNKGDIVYKDFKICDLFTSGSGDFDIQQKHINNKGLYVISSGLTNNGVIGKSDIKAKEFDKNTITVDMFGYSYFRNFKYKMVTHARVFSLKFKDKDLTAEEGLYFISQFKHFSEIFSYGNMASWEKIKDMIVKLPVTPSEKIDFDFINKFIKAQEKFIIKDVILWKDKLINE